MREESEFTKTNYTMMAVVFVGLIFGIGFAESLADATTILF